MQIFLDRLLFFFMSHRKIYVWFLLKVFAVELHNKFYGCVFRQGTGLDRVRDMGAIYVFTDNIKILSFRKRTPSFK